MTRESELFDKYQAILKAWNKKMNLVQRETLKDYFNRHVRDSLQIAEFIDSEDFIIDIGSGAGFPGVPLAIMGFSNVLLCEKNFKKCVFLNYLKERLGLDCSVYNGDVFDLDVSRETLSKAVAVSRAFGELSKLLKVLTVNGISRGVFHKGETYMDEVREAQKEFEFEYIVKSSVTSPKSAILLIDNVKEK